MEDVRVIAVFVKRLSGPPFQRHPEVLGHFLHPDVFLVGPAVDPVEVQVIKPLAADVFTGLLADTFSMDCFISDKNS